MRAHGQNYKPDFEPDEVEGRNTIEERLDTLKYQVADIEGVANHIHGILFGIESIQGEPLKDPGPSIHNTLADIEEHVREASKVLEDIASALSNTKRLKASR